MFLNGTPRSTEDIKIGVCADLDYPEGKDVWQAATLAAEQINAEGGVLGRNFTVVAEDNDASSSDDISAASNALTKIITVDKADYVVSYVGLFVFPYQDICAEQKKILIAVSVLDDTVSQRVLDNYDKYKYFFSVHPNSTTAIGYLVDSFLTLRNYTGFNKVAYLDQDASSLELFRQTLCGSLTEHGFNLVYQNSATWTTTDFTSYLTAIEASGAEILFPWIFRGAGVSFVKEWYNRQSPLAVWGQVDLAQYSDFWNLTESKCESLSFTGLPTIAGYPLTNKSVPTREAYLQRWQQIPTSSGVLTYDFVRFILPDAIQRAGTTETEAVIQALEKTDVETSTARHFIFSSSHGVFLGSAEPNKPNTDYMVGYMFQWQNGTKVPVYPEEIMTEAGEIYKYQSWSGPWDTK